MGAVDWDRKWKLMVDRENTKKMQNKIFQDKLKKKKELEEAIECTFQPRIQRKTTPGFMARRSRDELLHLFYPIISEEESILRELEQIEQDEFRNREELYQIIVTGISQFPNQNINYFLNFYRDERIKDISVVKNLKLEIIGKLQELERKFNLLCSSEYIDDKDLDKIGFDNENCRKIKEEILKSIDNYDTLKNRSKVSSEFEEILNKVKSLKSQNNNINNKNNIYNNITTTTNNHNINNINNKHYSNVNIPDYRRRNSSTINNGNYNNINHLNEMNRCHYINTTNNISSSNNSNKDISNSNNTNYRNHYYNEINRHNTNSKWPNKIFY